MMILFLSLILYQLIMALCPKVLNKPDKSTEQTTGKTVQDESVSAEAPTSTLVELREPLLDLN